MPSPSPPVPPRNRGSGGGDDAGPSNRRPGKQPVVDGTPPPSPSSSDDDAPQLPPEMLVNLIPADDVVEDYDEEEEEEEEENPATEREQLDLNVAFTETVGAVAARMLANAAEGKESDDEEVMCPDPECRRIFPKWKSLYGHMRCHPGRKWRGIKKMLKRMASRPGARKEAAEEEDESKKKKKFICECKQEFDSKQALGGHRASHKNVKGCYALSKEKAELKKRTGGGADGSKKPQFECEHCGRKFMNTQGLGAHKKIHLKGADKAMKLVVVPTAAAKKDGKDKKKKESPPKDKKKRKRKIDLNLRPRDSDDSNGASGNSSLDLNK